MLTNNKQESFYNLQLTMANQRMYIILKIILQIHITMENHKEETGLYPTGEHIMDILVY